MKTNPTIIAAAYHWRLFECSRIKEIVRDYRKENTRNLFPAFSHFLTPFSHSTFVRSLCLFLSLSLCHCVVTFFVYFADMFYFYYSAVLSVGVGVSVSVSVSVSISVCMFVCLSVYLSVCLSVCPSVCLSVWLSVCLYVCLSVHLSVSLSLFLSTSLPLSLRRSLYYRWLLFALAFSFSIPFNYIVFFLCLPFCPSVSLSFTIVLSLFLKFL
jgi:hypothetical protein